MSQVPAPRRFPEEGVSRPIGSPSSESLTLVNLVPCPRHRGADHESRGFEMPAIGPQGVPIEASRLRSGAPCPLFKWRRLSKERGALEKNPREIFAPTYSSR